MASALRGDDRLMTKSRFTRLLVALPLILGVVSCSDDDTSTPADTSPTSATATADTSPASVDTGATTDSSAPADSTVADSTVADSTVADSTVGDSTVADSTVTSDATAAVTTEPAAVGANAIPRLEGEVGALKDSNVTSCAKSGSGWAASGTVSNPTESKATYVVAVSFLDAANTTLGLNWTQIDDVAAGKKADWEVKAAITGDKLQCVLRVTRANL